MANRNYFYVIFKLMKKNCSSGKVRNLHVANCFITKNGNKTVNLFLFLYSQYTFVIKLQQKGCTSSSII